MSKKKKSKKKSKKEIMEGGKAKKPSSIKTKLPRTKNIIQSKKNLRHKVFFFSGAKRMSSSGAPRDAATVDEILRSMGVTDYEPGVLHQLLTFMHAHCAEIFSEGADYAAHAGRTAVECEDVRLACRLKSAEAQVTSAPFLEWLARERNGQPLPAAPTSTSGIQLPPQKFCLLAANYDLVPRAPAVEAAEDETPSQLRSGAEPPVRPKSAGPRIPIHLGAAQAATDALAPAQPAREGSGDAAMAEALDDDELWD